MESKPLIKGNQTSPTGPDTYDRTTTTKAPLPVTSLGREFLFPWFYAFLVANLRGWNHVLYVHIIL